MDKLTYYKSIVYDLASEITKSLENTVKVQLIADNEHGQFMVFQNDWKSERRLYGPILHLEVSTNEKVWIHHDGTDLVVAEMILEAGIPKNDIVLGFRSPVVRPDTGFAVA